MGAESGPPAVVGDGDETRFERSGERSIELGSHRPAHGFASRRDRPRDEPERERRVPRFIFGDLLQGQSHRRIRRAREAFDGHDSSERLANASFGDSAGHERGSLDAEIRQEIAHAVGVGGDRVVGARLVGATVTEQIGRDDGVVLGEVLDGIAPGIGPIADTVDQEDGGAVPVDSRLRSVGPEMPSNTATSSCPT